MADAQEMKKLIDDCEGDIAACLHPEMRHSREPSASTAIEPARRATSKRSAGRRLGKTVA
ncbi:hypothetical protein C770_GR4pC0404 (plasmid) [Sinorhizobium meliloti GR4]|jgi:hypothetical protein|nr:hypothetical protein C770_GR4pC0404 [Sinorhizobium meliloti GR4]